MFHKIKLALHDFWWYMSSNIPHRSKYHSTQYFCAVRSWPDWILLVPLLPPGGHTCPDSYQSHDCTTLRPVSEPVGTHYVLMKRQWYRRSCLFKAQSKIMVRRYLWKLHRVIQATWIILKIFSYNSDNVYFYCRTVNI